MYNVLEAVSFKIFGKPRPQKRPRVYKRKAIDPSAAEKQAFLMLAWGFKPEHPHTGPVYIELEFGYLAKARSADIDNLAKFVMDALNGTFYHDDRQITVLRAAKVIVQDDYTAVTIKYLSENERKQEAPKGGKND